MSKIGEFGVLSTLDLMNPQFDDHRSFTLRMRGKNEQHLTMRLQVLIPGSMYLVPDGCDESTGLKKGNVLIRNLDLQQRLNGGVAVTYNQQLFVRYHSVFEAYRAMSRINPTYKRVEIPMVENWLCDTDQLMKLAWTLTTKNVGKSHVEYTATAHEAARPSELAENTHKQAAYKQTMRASHVKDRSGRINAGRLPLMLLSVDVELWKRIVQVRGIGHRMDFRALVLDLFIQKMMEAVKCTQGDLVHKLRPAGVFGTDRSPNKIREVAKHFRASAAHLKTLVARPFSHVFDHVVEDLESAASLMDIAALKRSWQLMDDAESFLHCAYRSLAMVQQSWLIQEVLTTVAAAKHRKEELTVSEIAAAEFAVEAFLKTTSQNESYTNEPFEQDFANPILPRVRPQLVSVLEHLDLILSDPSGEHTKLVYKHLKAAVAPF